MVEFKAGVYDFDGCLVDSRQYNLDLINLALQARGRRCSEEEIHNAMTFTWDECVRLLLPRAPQDVLEDFKESVRSFEKQKIDQLKVFPKVFETLKEHRRQGLALAIVSNRETSIFRLLETTGLREYFHAIVSCDMVEKPKPHPESTLKALDRLRVLPHQAFGVGDSPSDIEAYKAAGLGMTIGVTHGYFGYEISKARPDYVVSSFAEIQNILGAASVK